MRLFQSYTGFCQYANVRTMDRESERIGLQEIISKDMYRVDYIRGQLDKLTRN